MSDRSTRYFSNKQEKRVTQRHQPHGSSKVANSGARPLDKGDVRFKHVLTECKTLIKPQKSRSIKKEWLTQVREEAFAVGKELSVLVFDFGDGDDFYAVHPDDFISLYEAWVEVNKGVE